MLQLIEKIIDIIGDLLPDRNQPTHIWASRFVILLMSFVGLYFVFILTIADTPLAEQLKINKNKILLPTLMEYAYTHRNVLSTLTAFKKQNYSKVSNIFLVALYNTRKNDYIALNPETNRDFLIWAWTIPVTDFDNLLNVETMLNTYPDVIFSNDWANNNACTVDKLPQVFKKSLKAIFPQQDPNYYVLCPITDKFDKHKIAFTISFANVLDEMEANILAYKQNITTLDVSRRISKFTIPYVLN